jgi:transcription elongation GreA/GreB family factor
MSRAFVKEDVDPPERSGRVRSASGLPPGAANYITAGGAVRLRQELEGLRGAGKGNEDRIGELERSLASAIIVEAPTEASDSIAFGARVTLRGEAGRLDSYRIVGVDELDFEPDAVSWISATGKALLAADLGDKVKLEDGVSATIVKVEYPSA